MHKSTRANVALLAFVLSASITIEMTNLFFDKWAKCKTQKEALDAAERFDLMMEELKNKSLDDYDNYLDAKYEREEVFAFRSEWWSK